MDNILDQLKGMIPPEIISNAANLLGENNNGITKALGGLLPTILGGLVQKSSDSSGFGDIFNMLSDNRNLGFLDNLGGLIGGGNLAKNDPKDIAGNLMSNLFGNKTGGILDLISSFAGIKKSSSSSLLGLAGPLVMGFLGKKIKSGGLNMGSLVSMLLGQKKNIMSALPAGMGSLLGFADTESTGTNKESSYTPKEETSRKGGGWWKWLLPLLAIAAILFLLKDCNGTEVADKAKGITEQAGDAVIDAADKTTDAVSDAAEGAVDAAKDAVAGLGKFFSRKLPSGVELNIPENGIEAQAVNFIEDTNRPIDKTTWFNFDRLVFKTGSANMDMEKSGEQLKNIAAIMSAYKSTKIKLGGYTDNTGNAESNMKLSQARADNVLAALAGLGVAANRMSAEGYGVQHPIASNDTEEGRAKNRRIALRFTEK